MFEEKSNMLEEIVAQANSLAKAGILMQLWSNQIQRHLMTLSRVLKYTVNDAILNSLPLL